MPYNVSVFVNFLIQITESKQTRSGLVFRQEWCLKVTAYDQDKFSSATQLCEANLALRDVKNLTTAQEALTISCNLARSNKVSCAVRSYVIRHAM